MRSNVEQERLNSGFRNPWVYNMLSGMSNFVLIFQADDDAHVNILFYLVDYVVYLLHSEQSKFTV